MKRNNVILSLFLLLLLISCKNTNHYVGTHIHKYEIQSTDEDQKVESLIFPYKLEVDKEMNEVIGQLEVDLVKRSPNGSMGYWLGDLLLEEAERMSGEDFDFAIHNSGGVRKNLKSKGAFQVKDAFEIMPFDNNLVVVDVPGDTVKVFVQHMANANGWPQSKELRYTLKDGDAFDVLVDGEEIASDKTYRIVMPDYVANGGNRCYFLVDLPKKDFEIPIREVIISNVRYHTAKGENMNPIDDQRIIIKR